MTAYGPVLGPPRHPSQLYEAVLEGIVLFAILGCGYLFISLPQTTQIYFLVAHVVGLAIYLLYGSRRSVAGAPAR